MQKISIGRIVHYKLGQADVDAIEKRRREIGDVNSHEVGQLVPMLVTRVWGDAEGVNGTAFLDGAMTLWLTSRLEGETAGSWCWPARA